MIKLVAAVKRFFEQRKLDQLRLKIKGVEHIVKPYKSKYLLRDIDIQKQVQKKDWQLSDPKETPFIGLVVAVGLETSGYIKVGHVVKHSAHLIKQVRIGEDMFFEVGEHEVSAILNPFNGKALIRVSDLEREQRLFEEKYRLDLQEQDRRLDYLNNDNSLMKSDESKTFHA